MSGSTRHTARRQPCRNAGALLHASTLVRSCHALGACQAAAGTGTPCPRVCRYPFAPGVVQGGPAVRRPRRLLPRISPLGQLVLQMIAILAVSAAVGHLAGVAQARGWFL